METDDKNLFNYKLEYLKLVLEITRLRLKGEKPPNELLQRAHEKGRLAVISEDELKNLWVISHVKLNPCSIVNHVQKKSLHGKLDIDLMTVTRELAQGEAKHQNDLIEEAIRDMLKNELIDGVWYLWTIKTIILL